MSSRKLAGLKLAFESSICNVYVFHSISIYVSILHFVCINPYLFYRGLGDGQSETIRSSIADMIETTKASAKVDEGTFQFFLIYRLINRTLLLKIFHLPQSCLLLTNQNEPEAVEESPIFEQPAVAVVVISVIP